MIKKITKHLSSLRFTILLIALLGVMFMIGLWVPQIRLVKELYLEWKQHSPNLVAFLDALGLTSIYTSWITVTLWILFFTNLSLVLWQRFPLIKKRITISEAKIADPLTASGYPFRRSFALPSHLDGDTVLASLRKKGYAIVGNASGFYGVRNRRAPIAFALFHVSFFLILLGGMISVYTEFVGYTDIAQGETFRGELTSYNRSPRPRLPAIGDIPQATFTIQSIVPHVVRNTPTGIDINLVDAEGQLHTAGINTPYTTDHTSFVFKQLGVAPLFVLKDAATGKEINGAYVKLDVMLGRKDQFNMGGFVFTALFYPDFELKNGKYATRSQEFNNPTFALVVQKDGKTVAEGVVPKNGVLEFPGYRLEMQDMPFWVRFSAIKQRGLVILYIGFAVATIGVIWRLLFYRREIVGAVRDSDGTATFHIAARSEYYKSLAEEEFDKLCGAILNDQPGLEPVEALTH